MSNGFFRGQYKAVPHPNPNYAALGAYCVIPTQNPGLAVADCESPDVARLMAASGDLAAALQGLLDYFAGYESDYEEKIPAFVEARTALAKARGLS